MEKNFNIKNVAKRNIMKIKPTTLPITLYDCTSFMDMAGKSDYFALASTYILNFSKVISVVSKRYDSLLPFKRRSYFSPLNLKYISWLRHT